MRLSGPALGTNVLLGAADATPLSGADDLYQSTGAEHARNLTGLYRHAPLTTSSVEVSVQGQQYLSQSVSVPQAYPSRISAVLRTSGAWVDRVAVRVAYQLTDSLGNVVVTQPSSVVMRITFASTTLTVDCDTSSTQSASSRYLGHCSSTSLSASWFSASTGTASVSVALRDSANAADVAVATLPSLTLHPQPSWWDTTLRSATLGNGLAAPTGVTSLGGVFVTLPTSPVYASEQFVVYLYAHTAGLALNTWRVRLYFGSSLLEYVSYAQSSLFNSASPSVSSGEVSWLATGLKSTTTDAQVTGSAIYLLTISMRVSSGVAAGTYDGSTLGLYPRATELISGAAFVQDADGQLFDGRDVVQTLGQLVVASSSTAGIFAYAPSGNLANLAPLTGVSSSHAVTVVAVGSDDRYTQETSDVSGAACVSGEALTVIEVSGCSVVLGPNQTTSRGGSGVTASFGGFLASAFFDVYTPQAVTLAVEDNELNRYSGAASESLSLCGAAGRTVYPYQRTRIRAYADGLEATPLVQFATDDSSVAGVLSVQYDVIEGRQAGATTAHLSGLVGAAPSVAISVTDTLVSVSELVVRVVTGVSWTTAPPSQYTFGETVYAVAEVANVMTAEGQSGRMFSRVVWSDAHEEDVGYSPVATIEEMSVVSGSSSVSLAAPSGSEGFWQVGVAVGALRECVTSVSVSWAVCGTTIASAQLPLFLDLPDPVAARLTMSEPRLTPVGDDASQAPISVPTSSALNVVVDFDDGSQRTMSADSRVTYSAVACATTDDGSDTVTISAAATCNTVTVVATVQLGSFRFVVNATTAVVRMDSIALSFSGYPDVGGNGALSVTTLGLVPCYSSTYFHATANVRASLSDASSYVVTSQSTFVSSAPTVVLISSAGSTRMQALSPGTSTIQASFGSQTTSSAALTVVDSALDTASSLAWSVPTLDANSLEAGASVATQVALTYASGLVHSDVASSTYDAWIDIETMVSFTSATATSLSVSAAGVLTLLDNHHTAVSLGASVACAPTIGATTAVYANLAASALDVDFGSLTGLQFSHGAGTTFLDVAVHVRPTAGTTLKAFQIKLGSLAPTVLNSAAGASWTDGGTFSGIETQFDNPSSEVVLSASDTASSVSSQVSLGSVRLNVLGSGVTLIQGEVTSIVVQDSTGTNSEVQYASVVAGRGYVSLTTGRRRALGGAGPLTSARELAPRVEATAGRRLQSSCSPCTAQVWGDFNGDCQFLTSDVLALSQFVLARERFEDGRDTVDPLLSYVGVNGDSCDWLRQQANPSYDLMSQAGSDTSDPRYGRPAVTGLDTQHLLYATVKKYRFLTGFTATCEASAVAGSTAQDLRVAVQLAGGDGQNAATVSAEPAFTDVFFELRISPTPVPFAFDFTSGTLAASKEPAGGFTGGVGSGLAVQASSSGSGTFEARLQPQGGYASGSGSYQIALVVETKTASGSKSVPSSYKAWQGTSMSPLTDYGVSYSALWGEIGRASCRERV